MAKSEESLDVLLGDLPAFTSKSFAQRGGGALRHAFFTRRGGCSEAAYESLNVSASQSDLAANVDENLARVARALGVPRERLVLPRETHSTRVLVVRDDEDGGGGGRLQKLLKERPDCDALVTAERSLALGVYTADCVPLLLYAPPSNPSSTGPSIAGASGACKSGTTRAAVGAAHAGHSGALAGVVQNVVNELCALSGSRPSELYAAIGPCIRQASYEVGSDLRERFLSESPVNASCFAPGRDAEHWQLDLPAYVRSKLLAAGVPSDRVYDVGLDTVTRPDDFFSYRRVRLEGKSAFGNQVSCIMLL